MTLIHNLTKLQGDLQSMNSKCVLLDKLPSMTETQKDLMQNTVEVNKTFDDHMRKITDLQNEL